jgi:hypothetical protein
MSIAPGNKTHIFPDVPPNSTEGRENSIVSNTERQMFHQSPAINNPARGMGGGVRNSIAEMTNYDGKRLNESYRIGLSRSAEGHDGVADR